jgi:hypothetical protein
MVPVVTEKVDEITEIAEVIAIAPKLRFPFAVIVPEPEMLLNEPLDINELPELILIGPVPDESPGETVSEFVWRSRLLPL